MRTSCCLSRRLLSIPTLKSSADSSWKFFQGSGKMAPAGATLKTDQYLILNHKNGLILELFYGSTGTVMFQGGERVCKVLSTSFFDHSDRRLV